MDIINENVKNVIKGAVKEGIEAGEIPEVVNVAENNEEKSLTVSDQKGIFSKIGTLFSNMWKAVKAYVNKMQVIEIKEEVVNVVEEEYAGEEVSQSVA